MRVRPGLGATRRLVLEKDVVVGGYRPLLAHALGGIHGGAELGQLRQYHVAEVVGLGLQLAWGLMELRARKAKLKSGKRATERASSAGA